MPQHPQFPFEPADWIPFRDEAVIDRLRNMGPAELARHDNPDLDIRVVPDDACGHIFNAEILATIQAAAAKNENAVFFLGNPNPGYRHLATILNTLGWDLSHVHFFAVDEWADQDGNTAPESYPQGFMHQFKKYLFAELDPKLNLPESHMYAPSTKTIDDYGKMVADLGGCSLCYTGCGWSAHSAFIDPDVPEWADDLDEFKKQGTRIVSLHPMTILQNSLHGSFGRSGDLTAVPPKAATIGPADMLAAKRRIDFSTLTIAGSRTSWQRLTARLLLHGPVTPKIPASILQQAPAPTSFIISETNAQPIEPEWYYGY